MPLFVDFSFVDNNGGKAKVRARFGGGFDAVASAATALATALEAISDARLVSFSVVSTFARAEAPPAQLTSNVMRVGLLFYRNGDDTASFYLPSIVAVLAETSGPYQGRRITRDSAGMLGLLESLDRLLDGALDPCGRPYGSAFSVGAITRDLPS
jgi:hypothetical protein